MSEEYKMRKYKTKAEVVRTIVGIVQLIVATATLIIVIYKY